VSAMIEPFQIAVPEATLEDLTRRLRHARWPDSVIDAAWRYGTNIEYLKNLVAYWLETFDWREQERRLNQIPQYRAASPAGRLHVVWRRADGGHNFPLLLANGWPSAFTEYLKLIPLLGSGRHGFDIVIPSIPGYGFSDRPTTAGMTPAKVATAWLILMSSLGYERFGVHASDNGKGVLQHMLAQAPERIVGYHMSNMWWGYSDEPSLVGKTSEEDAYLTSGALWDVEEGGYAAIQATRPQTLAYGLHDSPIGLAAWIVEKLRTWSDCDGDVERRFTKDEILTLVMIYWATGTINSANRYYFEASHTDEPLDLTGARSVPAAIAIFPKDISPAPRSWGERWLNLHRWTQMPRGGHFPAHEEPDLLAEDLIAFFGHRTHETSE
jgi:pimeloyl-ACP methyl ester carboxylesterase